MHTLGWFVGLGRSNLEPRRSLGRYADEHTFQQVIAPHEVKQHSAKDCAAQRHQVIKKPCANKIQFMVEKSALALLLVLPVMVARSSKSHETTRAP